MKILSAHIDGFGKFSGKDIDFSEGLNVIHGNNEAGKSTLHGFLEAMLFGPEKKASESYRPWNRKLPYGGSLRISFHGSVYRIERDLGAEPALLSVYNETKGSPVRDPEELIRSALCGLSPKALRSSLSVRQLSAKTGAGLAKELAAFAGNMGSTQNPELSADAAVAWLDRKEAGLRALLSGDAAKDYAASLSRIKTIEEEIGRPENENLIPDLLAEKNKVKEALAYAEYDIYKLEQKMEEESRVLSETEFGTRDTVERLDREVRGMYDSWKKLKKEDSDFRKTGLLLLGILLAGFGALDLTVLHLLAKIPDIALLLLGLLLFGFFSAKKGAASKAYQKQNGELSRLLSARTGSDVISDTNVEDYLSEIHRMDEVITEKEADSGKREELFRKISTLHNEHASYVDRVEEQQKVLIRVEEKLSEANELRDQASKLQKTIDENAQIETEIEAIDMARETIRDLQSSIRGRLGNYLNDEASHALDRLTGGRYKSIDIGNGNSITVSSEDGMIRLSDLSAGTVDQVYLAVRLAAARFMMNGADELPLVFDDSFAFYDRNRLSSALSYITGSYKGQILIFTCHDREAEVLAGQEFRLIEL